MFCGPKSQNELRTMLGIKIQKKGTTHYRGWLGLTGRVLVYVFFFAVFAFGLTWLVVMPLGSVPLLRPLPLLLGKRLSTPSTKRELSARDFATLNTNKFTVCAPSPNNTTCNMWHSVGHFSISLSCSFFLSFSFSLSFVSCS